ncbi:DUF1294 domain-containing protein [Vannielia litorea]|uniref:DUF1294 domain-containing protein n=1 Tax=Vannielia litorea TaxID=1217970 RepID=UPI001BCBF800|nr:DUF1294 domain-containing protein [Vannielia litorea]MBS8228755.1 DUF1294 domain-containing protein [Vannielia litorea]
MTFAALGTPLPPWLVVALLFCAVNLLAFALFSLDKTKARMRDRRISEAALLTVAALGGVCGAKAGQRLLRHKTLKQPFARRLNAIGLLQGVLVVALVWAVSR